MKISSVLCKMKICSVNEMKKSELCQMKICTLRNEECTFICKLKNLYFPEKFKRISFESPVGPHSPHLKQVTCYFVAEFYQQQVS